MAELCLHNQLITVRAVEQTDADQLSALLSDWQTVEQSGLQLPDPANTTAWQWALLTLTTSNNLLVIEERARGQLAGLISLVENGPALELGYLLGPAFRGRGLMTMAVRLVLEQLAKQQQAVTVVAATDQDNTASIAVLRRTGFKWRARDQDHRQVEWIWTNKQQKN